MSPSGHRGFGALVLLVLLALSGLAVLPWNVQAQANQIIGLVYDCGSPATFVAGATVTLTDTSAVQPIRTTTTAGDGTFSFTPNPGYFTVKIGKSGYFENGTASPIRFDGTSTVNLVICLKSTPTPGQTLTVTVEASGTGAPIANATVDAFWAPEGQVVATAKTGGTGQANLTLWAGTFELRTKAAGFSPDVQNVDPGVTPSVTVTLGGGVTVTGHARNSTGAFLSAGLTGALYNLAPAASLGLKVIPAEVTGSLYIFHAPPGSYRMVVDANGYLANATTVTLSVGPPRVIDVTLARSSEETFQTIMVYGATDWSNLTGHRNVTLNPDSTYPGLEPAGVRDLRLQIDFTFGTSGTRDGLVDAAEEAAFQSWLVGNGPFYTTTDGFLTTNSKAYISSTTYTVGIAGLQVYGGKVWINGTTSYALKQTPYIPVGAPRYFVNVTARPDTNVSVHKNESVALDLPPTYERGSTTTVGNVTVYAFLVPIVDPGVAGAPVQARMTVEWSMAGVARGKVVAPVGKFHAVNASYENYLAYVANNTTITFSAEDSTDPVSPITAANFTWRFLANTSEGALPQNIGYGIRSNFTYTTYGWFTVNLTVRQAGGNFTYRNISVVVDSSPPIGKMRTNRTGTGEATGTLQVNQDTIVRFDGGLSTDLAFPGKSGIILNGGYSWDFNGDRIADAVGRVVNWTFEKPGNFTVNLTVTDSVGWKSPNASLTVVVADTEPPSPSFVILNPLEDYAVTTQLEEKHPYTFNASGTTDNYNTRAELNYTWTIPGPVEGRAGTNHTFYGMNITFTWTEWNNSYKVVLKVKDTGFGSGTPNTGTLTQNISVNIIPRLHPDLLAVQASLKGPTSVEESATFTVSVNVTNKPDRGSAGNVTTSLYVVVGGASTLLTQTADWYRNGTPTSDRTIRAGETVTLVFRASISGQGNKTFRACVTDLEEPYTWEFDNCATQAVFVGQAAWVNWAIYGSIAGVLGAFVFAVYYRRKVRAGEWRRIGLLDRSGKKEAAPGEKKAKKEVKEEKKRL